MRMNSNLILYKQVIILYGLIKETETMDYESIQFINLLVKNEIAIHSHFTI